MPGAGSCLVFCLDGLRALHREDISSLPGKCCWLPVEIEVSRTYTNGSARHT